jgi:hypothetical protein
MSSYDVDHAIRRWRDQQASVATAASTSRTERASDPL